MTLSEPRWFVVRTRPNLEARALAHLGRQGFEAYLPRYAKRRRHARRVETVLAPLFSRYLFVKIDVGSQRWRSVQSTTGVSQLVCVGEEPASVPEDVITALRQREGADGAVQLEQAARFAPGQQVRINDGVFATCLGLYEGMTDHDRVAVLLDLLGRKVRVSVDDISISAA